MMNILLVEDDPGLAQSVKDYLTAQGYLCESAGTFSDADLRVNIYRYDCVIVDITLPDGNGLNIVRALKKIDSPAGILIISAKNSLDDKIVGLDLGADDYLTKPFHLAELNARVKSILRRRLQGGLNHIEAGKLSISPEAREVLIENNPVILTRKEFDLLYFLVSNQEQVISKETIAEHLWGSYVDQSDSFDFIYHHIKNLRKKLADCGADDNIKSVYGVGYRFKVK
ncbi:response regulator transcription factor [Calditrichota bacterium]